MSTTKACRAKNPDTCPYHGIKGLGEPTFANDYLKLLDAPLAARIYNKAKAIVEEKTPDMFDDIEGFKEYREIAAHAQAVYDSTITGQKELTTQIRKASTLAEKEALKSRKEIGAKYREAILMSRSEIKKSEANFRDIADDHSVAVHEVDDNTISEVAAALRGVPTGTPLVIKTNSGDYIYTTAGTGRFDNKKNWFGYSGFVSGNKTSEGRWTSLSLAGFYDRLPLEHVKEIIVAKDYVTPHSVIPRLHSKFGLVPPEVAKKANRVVVETDECVVESSGNVQFDRNDKIGKTQYNIHKVGEKGNPEYLIINPLKIRCSY